MKVCLRMAVLFSCAAEIHYTLTRALKRLKYILLRFYRYCSQVWNLSDFSFYIHDKIRIRMLQEIPEATLARELRSIQC